MEAYVGDGFQTHLPCHLGSGLRLPDGCRWCIPLLHILAPAAMLHGLDAFLVL
jgi:hypothetical protein